MIKLIELFSGYGSQALALRRLGLDVDHVAISEINKYAIKAHEVLHGKIDNLGDISKVDSLPPCDLLTYSFPCQDLSVQGLQRGLDEGTRSGLLWQVDRLMHSYKQSELPSVLMLENVLGILNSKNIGKLHKWLNRLEGLGYKNYIYNTTPVNHNIPQSRGRVIIISIKGKHLLDMDLDEPTTRQSCISLQSFLFGAEAKEYDKATPFTIGDNVTERRARGINKARAFIEDKLIVKNDRGNKDTIRADMSPFINFKVDQEVCVNMAACIRASGTSALLYDSKKNMIRVFKANELLKLQGLKDDEIELMQASFSGAAIKRLAGNSICVDVLVDIFKLVHSKGVL